MVEIVHDPLEANVAQKLILRQGNKLLLLKHQLRDAWDFPGGRLNKTVTKNPTQAELLKEFHREVLEEVGEDVEYTIEPNPITTALSIKKDGKRYIFLVFYEGEYNKGEIKLCEEHTEYKWVDVNTYEPEKDTWIPEYLEVVKNYLEKVRSK